MKKAAKGRRTPVEPMTATTFAEEMGVSYPTVVRWLKRGIVPGAELRESPDRGKWWEIPLAALDMQRPKWGGFPNGPQAARKGRKGSKIKSSKIKESNDQ
jgi:hypothetical protein